MPVHRIPKGHLYEDLVSLEREHELVSSIVPDPADPERFCLVVTRFCGDTETRSS